MKKSEVVQLFAAAEATINHLRDNLYLLRNLNALRQLESEERLLQKVLSFQLSPGFGEKSNEDEVKFSEFIKSTSFTDLSLKLKEEGQLARICHLWLKDQVADQCTFMGTEITKIPLKNLVYLDEFYFDIREILSFMSSQQASGGKIFQNPESVTRASFSLESASILIHHSATKDFLTVHSAEEEVLAVQRSQLPDRFFDLLHEYLIALYEIGKNRSTGNWDFFTEASIQQYDDARQAFFNTIDQEISTEQRLVLSKIKIYAPLKVGGTEDVAYSKVVEGRDGYNCVISQQIYLWAFLRERRPETMVPNEVSRHWQANRYDLGDNNALQNTPATNDLPIDSAQFILPDFSQIMQTAIANLQTILQREDEQNENLLRRLREATENISTRTPAVWGSFVFSSTTSSPHRHNFNSFFTTPARNREGESQFSPSLSEIESAWPERDSLSEIITNHLRFNVMNDLSLNLSAPSIILLQNNNLSISRENNETSALAMLSLAHSNQNNGDESEDLPLLEEVSSISNDYTPRLM